MRINVLINEMCDRTTVMRLLRIPIHASRTPDHPESNDVVQGERGGTPKYFWVTPFP